MLSANDVAVVVAEAWTIDIVKRSDVAKGFVLLPRRWVVERTLGLDQPQPRARQGLRELNRNRRGMAHDRRCQTHHEAIDEGGKTTYAI